MTDKEWVLVPREPTEEMRSAGITAIQERYRKDGGWCGLLPAQEQMMETWKAMLASAPKRPTEEEREYAEGCTPTDVQVLRDANLSLASENERLRDGLR